MKQSKAGFLDIFVPVPVYIYVYCIGTLHIRPLLFIYGLERNRE